LAARKTPSSTSWKWSVNQEEAKYELDWLVDCFEEKCALRLRFLHNEK